jgi:hypothetical protein
MKHLRKFNEGFYQDELVYSLVYFNDKYGEPHILSEKYGDSYMITLTWDLGIDLSTFDDASKSLEKLQDLAVDMDHILTARNRHKDYNFFTSITSKLKLKAIPKEVKHGNYEFIVLKQKVQVDSQSWRNIRINVNQIERFFNTKGISVRDYHEHHLLDGSSLFIQFDKNITDHLNEFRNLFREEYDKIDRTIGVTGSDNVLQIYPEGEKTYVTSR